MLEVRKEEIEDVIGTMILFDPLSQPNRPRPNNLGGGGALIVLTDPVVHLSLKG